ncbi:MAG: hypothetical protein U0U66_12155 [Cytophagaceae bacterium]
MRNYFILLFNFSFLVYCQGQTNYFPQTDQVGIMLNPAVSGLDRRLKIGAATGWGQETDNDRSSRDDFSIRINQLTFSSPLNSKYYIGGYLLNRNFVSDLYLDGYDPSYTTFTYNSTYKKYSTVDGGLALSRPFYLDKKSQEESNHVLIPALGIGIGYQNYFLETYSNVSPIPSSKTEKMVNLNQATLGFLYQYRKKLIIGSKLVSYLNLYDGYTSKVFLHASYTITSKNGKGKFMFKPSVYAGIYSFLLIPSSGERITNANGVIHYYNRGLGAILQLDFRWYGVLWGVGMQSFPSNRFNYYAMIGYEAKSFRTTLNISGIGEYYNSGSFTFVKYFNKN